MREAIAVCLMLAACASPSEPEPGEEIRLAADASFSEGERVELVAAVARWREASAGRMNVALVREGERARGAIHRGASDLAYRRATLEVWIDVEGSQGAGPDVVRRLAMHYEGRLFGLGPLAGARAILNPDDIAGDLTPRDVDACRSAGLCP